MCGRFALRSSFQQLKKEFSFQHYQTEFNDDLTLDPSYNIAPGQKVMVLVGDRQQKKLIFQYFRWGLIPFWAKDQSIGNKLINARAETVDQKPSFKHSFKHRRCAVIADGFYEWKKDKSGKSPYFIQMKDQRPFGFAGVYDHWKMPQDRTIDSCAIITTEPNDRMREIHSRMPVILDRNQLLKWIMEDSENTECLKSILKPFNQNDLKIYEVSSYVNSPSNNSEQCIKPLNNGDQ